MRWYRRLSDNDDCNIRRHTLCTIFLSSHYYFLRNNIVYTCVDTFTRIKSCRAGRCKLAIGILALVFVVAFAVGLFFKWFWRSFFFDSPLYLIIIVIGEVLLGFSANYIEKRETAELTCDIENTIFEEWYEDPNAVRIKVQPVYGTLPTQLRGGQAEGHHSHLCGFFPCRGSKSKRQGYFISITFQREDDSESIAGRTRTMDTHSVDQLHV